MTYSRNADMNERHFAAARATVADLRARKLRLEARLRGLAKASLEWRKCRAELLSVDGAMDRANGALTAARRRVGA